MSDNKVLVLDDEELILELVKDILTVFGFCVKTAVDGIQAVELFRRAWEKGEPFDLVILDMTLPGELDGVATLENIRAIDPDVKAIISSGYTGEDIMSNPRKYGFDAAVSKPYSVSVLHQVIQGLVDDAHS